MVKVLVIGAAGYIGLRLSQHLRQANHIVYGTTRSPSNESILAINEIIPIVGPVEHESTKDLPSLLQKNPTPAWLEAVKTENIDQSINQPPTLVTWRPELERQVLASYEHLYAAIVRPPIVFGGIGSVWDVYFEQIYKAVQNNTPISLAANPDAGVSLVNVDDAASAFVALVDKLEIVSGHKDAFPIFDVATSHESLAYVLTKFAKEIGYKGPKIEFIGVPEGKSFNDLFIQAYNTQAFSASTRAQSILGWRPRKVGFAVALHIYAKSWVAGFKERSAK
ncbi:hypothetical protein BGX29_008203 [Mortierella sp. GBA35]|nr:hypothetical protein BGX29_008203 [Mortierella sp. GBA35]